jgi:hypothetical protein
MRLFLEGSPCLSLPSLRGCGAMRRVDCVFSKGLDITANSVLLVGIRKPRWGNRTHLLLDYGKDSERLIIGRLGIIKKAVASTQPDKALCIWARHKTPGVTLGYTTKGLPFLLAGTSPDAPPPNASRSDCPLPRPNWPLPLYSFADAV